VTTYLYIGSSTEKQDVEQQAERLARVYPYDIMVREPNADPGAKPKLDRLLKRLRQGDRLIIKDVSRLGRSIIQAARVAMDLKARGVLLVVDNLESLCNPTLSVFTLIECAAWK
jgi:DNA invertase Pin-like site-specific DNA recombinase